MKIPPNAKLLFIGDSITDAGRNKALGEGLFDPLGTGYVNKVESLLTATYPERRIRVINHGLSGNTVRDLKARWSADVLSQEPDWVSILIGINDVWRQFDSPRRAEIQVSLEEYERTLEELVRETLRTAQRVVILSPFHIESHRSDAMRVRMEQFAIAAQAVAGRTDSIHVDVQAGFDELLRHYHSSAIAWDRVHPNQAGHTVIARAFLRAVDFVW